VQAHMRERLAGYKQLVGGGVLSQRDSEAAEWEDFEKSLAGDGEERRVVIGR
jgi:hypothetical protein